MASKISQYFSYLIAGKEFKIRFKIPTVGEQISIGQTFAAYKAGFDKLDEASETLAYALATLNNVIVDKPSDLKLEEVTAPDWIVLRKMVEDYNKFAFFRDGDSTESTAS